MSKPSLTDNKALWIDYAEELEKQLADMKDRIEWREDGHDGIYCRDETIRLQDQLVDEARVQLAAVRPYLQHTSTCALRYNDKDNLGRLYCTCGLKAAIGEES